jgi:hypothetical protein
MTKTCGQQLALNSRESGNLPVQRMCDWSRKSREGHAEPNGVLTPYQQTPNVPEYQVLREPAANGGRNSRDAALAWRNLINLANRHGVPTAPRAGARFRMVSPLSIFSGFAATRRSGGIPGKRLGSYCFLVLLTFCFSDFAAAQASKEYQIKAVLLLNLTRFVSWPDAAFAGPDSPIVIGIVGRDPFGDALDEVVKGEQVNGRSIVVERYPTAEQIRPCQILFVSRSEKAHIKQILARAQNKPVLTVSEMEGFAGSDGGMVRLFVNEQKRVRLEVNLQAVEAHDLKLSAKLLQVAEVTRGRPMP